MAAGRGVEIDEARSSVLQRFQTPAYAVQLPATILYRPVNVIAIPVAYPCFEPLYSSRGAWRVHSQRGKK